jgi:hypothetical protein
MNLDLNPDQAPVAEELNRWSSDHMQIPSSSQPPIYLPGEALAEELVEHGYMDIVREPELGQLGGVLLIEAVARTPWAIEVNASGMVAPALGLSGLPRPLAIIDPASPATRFLVSGGAALIDAGDHVRLLRCDDRVKPVQNTYPYPFGQFAGDLIKASERLDNANVRNFRDLRSLAALAEASGAMDSSMKLTVEYVKGRVAFKRPIGSFQAVQHKLAECAALVHGTRLLIYRAAVEGPAFLDHAVNYAHDAITQVIQETTQFHGAIGQTLEYPLHLWNYRLRVLQFELYRAAGTTRASHKSAT